MSTRATRHAGYKPKLDTAVTGSIIASGNSAYDRLGWGEPWLSSTRDSVLKIP
jgi:hypothetical protein